MIVCCWTSAFRSRAYLNPWCTSNLFAGVGSSFSTLNSNIDRVPYKPSHYFCLLDRASYSSGEWTEFLQLSWAHANTYASSDKMSQLSYVQLASQQTTINVGPCILPRTRFWRFRLYFCETRSGSQVCGPWSWFGCSAWTRNFSGICCRSIVWPCLDTRTRG